LKIQIPYNPEGRYSGIFFWMLLFIVVSLIYHYKLIKKDIRRDFAFWLFFGLLLYFLLSVESKAIWQLTLPVSRLLQFPWRILILLSFIFPFLLAYGVSFIRKPFFRAIFLIPLLGLIIIFLPSFKPREYSFFYEYSAEDTGICATTWEQEYLPVWVKECAGGPARNEIEVRNGTFLLAKNNKLLYEGTAEASTAADLIVYKYFFPGWHVMIDGRESPLDNRFSKQGIFKSKLPKGKHTVEVKYSKTFVMWFSDILSAISSIVVIYLGILWLTRRKKH
jgi:hypothetical protein